VHSLLLFINKLLLLIANGIQERVTRPKYREAVLFRGLWLKIIAHGTLDKNPLNHRIMFISTKNEEKAFDFRETHRL
jgi:hypothetical protein